MGKIRLDPEALQVDSFATDRGGEDRGGTVHAMSDPEEGPVDGIIGPTLTTILITRWDTCGKLTCDARDCGITAPYYTPCMTAAGITCAWPLCVAEQPGEGVG